MGRYGEVTLQRCMHTGMGKIIIVIFVNNLPQEGLIKYLQRFQVKSLHSKWDSEPGIKPMATKGKQDGKIKSTIERLTLWPPL